jgi:hypothetical protein
MWKARCTFCTSGKYSRQLLEEDTLPEKYDLENAGFGQTPSGIAEVYIQLRLNTEMQLTKFRVGAVRALYEEGRWNKHDSWALYKSLQFLLGILNQQERRGNLEIYQP